MGRAAVYAAIAATLVAASFTAHTVSAQGAMLSVYFVAAQPWLRLFRSLLLSGREYAVRGLSAACCMSVVKRQATSINDPQHANAMIHIIGRTCYICSGVKSMHCP